MYVSVSAYNDAALLDGCLESITEHCPGARVTVVDGKYTTFEPGAPPNSTDHTAAVADAHGARYDPAGPFDREVDKHRYRVSQAPPGEWALFIDADERLAAADFDALERGRAYCPRIFNALVYSDGTPVVYWPRIFDPATVAEVSRWDAYLFDVPVERTDAVSIAHRHDLRDRAYREAKYDRFEREGRTGRYSERFDTYLENGWDVPTSECPACGRDSLVTSPATAEGDGYSRVQVCLAGDGCYRAVESVDVGEWRYLPDRVAEGFEADPARLRLELLDAGCDFVAMADYSTARNGANMAAIRPAVELWVADTFERAEPKAFE